MKKSGKFAYFTAGTLSAVALILVGLIAVPSFAATVQRTIDVFTGVTIYVDEIRIDPRDANGNYVEPFIYNGTTYLPVRAVSEALGKPVAWDGSTYSVYIGKHSSDEPAILVQDLAWFTGGAYDRHASLTDNLGNTRNNCIGNYKNAVARDNLYKINGQYTRIAGILFQTYDARNGNLWGTWTTLEIYGDGKALYTASVTSGVEPIDFSVDISGVLELRIRFYSGSGTQVHGAAISNFGLYT
jgi:hypothetical protein